VGNLIEAIITEISGFVMSMISTFGYAGIFLTMAIESACIPLPSEIIMPFAGYLVTTGQFTMLGVTLAGAIGNVAGSDASDRPDLHLVAGRHRRCEHLSVHTLHLSRCAALVLSSGLCRRENGRALGAAERLFPSVRYCDRCRARLGHRLLCVVALAKAPAETGIIGSRC